MRIAPVPHRWSLTPRAAAALQRRLAARVSFAAPRHRLRRVAGMDAAFSADGRCCIAGVVVWDCVDRAVLEAATAMRPLTFPYVPGLLSFREGPP